MKTFIEQFIEARRKRRDISMNPNIVYNKAVHDYWFLKLRRLEQLATLNPSKRDSI